MLYRPPPTLGFRHSPPFIPLPGIVPTLEEVLSSLGRKTSSHRGSQPPLEDSTSWPPGPPPIDSSGALQGTWAKEGVQEREPQETLAPSTDTLPIWAAQAPLICTTDQLGASWLFFQDWLSFRTTFRFPCPALALEDPRPCPSGSFPASVGLRDRGRLCVIV